MSKTKTKTAAAPAAAKVVSKDGEVAVYQIDGEGASLAVRVDKDTIWLTQAQMAILFGCERTNVTQHLKHIFDDGELEKSAVCKDFSHTAADGKTYTVAHYNLDAVISVGFRVNSKRGIAFRQWANGVIRDCMLARLAAASAAKNATAATRRPSPCNYELPESLYKAKSVSICAKCLFGRLVSSEARGIYCECHIARPTTYGFPIVRPDDFCGQHVDERGTFRTFAAVIPEPPQLSPSAGLVAPSNNKTSNSNE